MKKRHGKSDYRWLWAVAVLAAVAVLVASKATRGSGQNLPEAQGRGSATLPALSAASVGVAADPFPPEPAAQLDWVLRNQKPAMLLFHSTNCKPCKVMSALVDKLRPEYERAVVFVDVITNDQANAGLVQRAQIRAIPTSFFLSSAGEARGFVGAMPEEELRAELARLLQGS